MTLVARGHTVGTGPVSVAVAPEGGQIYVANAGSNLVSLIEPPATWLLTRSCDSY
jgi:DNA-binding beta-propeller fold protein YncE